MDLLSVYTQFNGPSMNKMESWQLSGSYNL